MQFSHIVCRGSPNALCSLSGRGVGGVEDHSPSGPQQTARHSLTAVAFQEFIGNAWQNDPVHPAFEDGGRHAPPVGMNYYYPVCHGQLPAMYLNHVVLLCIMKMLRE
jgi:hypothetical protein